MPGRYRFPRPSSRLRQTRPEPRHDSRGNDSRYLRVMTCRLTEGLSWPGAPRGCQQRHPVLPA
jgi:hypothetical protein